MYFARLAVLKPAVEKIAGEAWDDFEVRLLRRPTFRKSTILREDHRSEAKKLGGLIECWM